ncbi:hypothetical protein QE438_002424 [Pseudoxanthomonas sp. SORGH_AS 997]|nr:hypothetical protein [Pseudoxanthomonas sp. SORGH_AS_0997]
MIARSVAALPLGQVIGHVRHEVGVGAVGLAHHAVLVVAVVGRLEPQRAAFLVGVAGLDQRLDGLLNLAVAVKRALQEVHVEAHAEGGQVGVLLAAQVGHGEAADGIEVLDVLGAGDGVAFDLDGIAAQVGGGDIGDVVAVVGRLGPVGVAGLEAVQARIGGPGQVLDLYAGVVVVELALGVPAVGGQHARQAVADHRGAAVAHVQRAGRIGRDVFHADRAAGAGRVAAVLRALG